MGLEANMKRIEKLIEFAIYETRLSERINYLVQYFEDDEQSHIFKTVYQIDCDLQEKKRILYDILFSEMHESKDEIFEKISAEQLMARLAEDDEREKACSLLLSLLKLQD